MKLRDLVNLHKRQLVALIEKGGVRNLKPFYDSARRDLEDRLRVLKNKNSNLNPQALKIVLNQAVESIIGIENKLSGHLKEYGVIASRLATKQLLKEVESVESKIHGVAPSIKAAKDSVVSGVIRNVQTKLEERYDTSSKLYGPPTVKKVKEALSLSLISSEPVEQTIEKIAGADGVIENERWRAERIARSEISNSFGQTKQAHMEELQNDFGDLQKRLISIFDDRTGEDSYEQHLQTVGINEQFVWHKKNGEIYYYDAPPNRPNDRATMIVWRKSWGI